MQRATNIDLIHFEQAESATDALQSGGDVHGVEIKTKRGIRSESRLEEQIDRYTESNMLSKFSIAVPETVVDETRRILQEFTHRVSDLAGIISIANDGQVSFVRSPERLDFEYDAYTIDAWDDNVFVGYEQLERLNDDLEPVSVLNFTGK